MWVGPESGVSPSIVPWNGTRGSRLVHPESDRVGGVPLVRLWASGERPWLVRR